MPWKPKTICVYPGCHQLVNGPYCDEHKKLIAKKHNDKNSKLYTYRWRKASKQFLKEHPLCRYCEQEDRVTAASEVDHRIPHGGNLRLFWDRSNWQPLCKKCHSRKTALEDGGFDNKRKQEPKNPG